MDFRSERSESEERDYDRGERTARVSTAADSESDRWKLFRPFPRQTSTLVAGPSFLGKSTYVRKLVEYQHLFFQDPVARLVVINCNDAVTFSSLEEPRDASPLRRPLAQLLQHTWADFELSYLEEGDVLVIDDLAQVTARVREIVNAATHHLSLAHCFLITHSVLGCKQYELLNLVHRVALFCSSTSVANLAGYVLSTRILDSDLKARLREALGAAQRSREVLLLELSCLPDALQPYHVACSHLLRLTEPDRGFAVVYPHPSRVEMYNADADDVEDVEMKNPVAASANLPGPGEFVGGSFLVLRPDQVASLKMKKKKKKKKGSEGASSGEEVAEEEDECESKDKKLWDSTVLQLEEDVENFLPTKQWRHGKSLLYEILSNPSMCLLRDNRRIRIHDRPEVVSGLFDYLIAATRRDAPNEKRGKGQTLEYKNYRHVTAALLECHAPRTLFKNKLVFPGPSESRSLLTTTRTRMRRNKKEKSKRRRMHRGSKKNEESSSTPSLSSSDDASGLEDLDFSSWNQ